MTKAECWICSEKAMLSSNNYIKSYACDRCGRYKVEWPFCDDYKFEDERTIANISGWVWENQGVTFDFSTFEKLKVMNSPNVNERINKLLRWLDSRTDYLGKELYVDTNEKKLLAICWATKHEEVEYLLQHLIDRKFIEYNGTLGFISFEVMITTNGFQHLDELTKKINSNLGFCAMSFDENLLSVWNLAISPAMVSAGYEALRIDSEMYNTSVVDQIKAKIRQAKFLVADLTMHKQGVYWEAGFADGLGREVIYTCRDDEFEKRHFDVQHINTIKWKADALDDFKKMLSYRIEGTIGRGLK